MAEDKSPKRVLEFYSGIGGLRYSLEKSGVKAVLVEAFDINEIANDVYEHNFGHRPSQGNIQGLSVQQLDKYKADAWLMSPPCQPFTRQGLKKDAADARASSFLKIMKLLPLMASPPTNVMVENVVGFENSVTHSLLLAMLEEAGFVMQEFILSPLQFGIPYSRPRYFCLAKRIAENFVQPGYNGQLLCSPGPLLDSMQTQSNSHADGKSKDGQKVLGLQSEDEMVKPSSDCVQGLSSPIQSKRNEPIIDPAVPCGTVEDYLESIPAHALEEGDESQLVGPSGRDGSSPEVTSRNQHNLHVDSELSAVNMTSDMGQAISSRGPSKGLSEEDQWKPYKVPTNVVERWIDAYDIVTPKSRRCCCFTKSYTRYTKGTGSFLATKVSFLEEKSGLEKHIFDLRLEGRSLASLGLRYFTPREVANLHSFPDTFRFPTHIKLKQRYALLGNSLSVAVVSSLLNYLFSTPTIRDPSVDQS